jgi:hypothetical protein
MKPLTGLAVFAMLVADPALGQDTPRDLRDMVGARAGQAEGELQRRGYRNVRGESGDDRGYTYWWNADRRQCVTIATMEGRYDSITSSPAPDCRQPAADRRDRRPRYARERREDYGGAYGSATADLSRYCKGEAAAAFDRRPSEITTNAPIRQRTGTIVQGWYDRSNRTRFFTCRFDEDDRFISVN